MFKITEILEYWRKAASTAEYRNERQLKDGAA